MRKNIKTSLKRWVLSHKSPHMGSEKKRTIASNEKEALINLVGDYRQDRVRPLRTDAWIVSGFYKDFILQVEYEKEC
jgi:hypothetical protein